MKITNAGFTLIEVMIVLAILGILVAVVLPHYTNQILRSERTECYLALRTAHTSQVSYFASADTFKIGNSTTINPMFGLPSFQTSNGYDFSVSYTPIPPSLPPYTGVFKGYHLGLFKNLDNDITQDIIAVQVDPNTPMNNGIPILYVDDIAL